MHTVNYMDTLVAVAPDSPAEKVMVPRTGPGRVSIAEIQFDLLTRGPYRHTQEEVLWRTHVRHKALTGAAANRAARLSFLAKPHPCLRSSPLPKRYGWGLYFDSQGKVALVARASKQYASLAQRASPGFRALPRSTHTASVAIDSRVM